MPGVLNSIAINLALLIGFSVKSTYTIPLNLGFKTFKLGQHYSFCCDLDLPVSPNYFSNSIVY